MVRLEASGGITEPIKNFEPTPPDRLFQHDVDWEDAQTQFGFKVGQIAGRDKRLRVEEFPWHTPEQVETLAPYLEPSVLTPDVLFSVLPGPIRDYQMEAILRLLAQDILLLGDDPGLGKTVVACAGLLALIQLGRVARGLVVCPKSMILHWADHLALWAPGAVVYLVRGHRSQRKVDWRSSAHVFLTDPETLAFDLEHEILSGSGLKFDVLVLDGALPYQSPSFDASLEQLRVKRRWVLTNTLPREAETWEAVLRVLTSEIYRRLETTTLLATPRDLSEVILRRKKTQVARDLPNLTRQEIWLPFEAEHAEAYQEALNLAREELRELDDHVSMVTIANAVNRLKQACNFAPGFELGGKAKVLIELVDDITVANAKVVVFSQFHQGGLDSLQVILESYGLLRLDSNMTEDQIHESLEAFREDERWRVLLVQTGLKADGLTLPDASYLVHYDPVWDPSLRSRSEREFWPFEKARLPLHIYELYVVDSLDRDIYEMLQARGISSLRGSAFHEMGGWDAMCDLEYWMQEIFEIEPSDNAQ
jgi:SNF2 family DNA or RNA helicase